MDSAVGKRQLLEEDYNDDYWWHSSVRCVPKTTTVDRYTDFSRTQLLSSGPFWGQSS